MLNVRYTVQFKKDYKLAVKRGYNPKELEKVIDLLKTGEPLPQIYKDHPLSGEWKNYRDCHIRPDWILIYRVIEDSLILELSRTGTHSDLFKK
ncbi:type II toxin-antitoxin system YafQ family toxin [Treponema vincentii]|mgnify:CR=1 FL=1|jgi:addiction module toxin, relE/stbE family|uniref:RelE/StbE family addiction module toxin n=2 Tax=Treponema vincentii TaxID=69710 RepID=S3LCQ9_9SPIR|nr:type II toxin-antitoxin system YafQ family toxin [Treponema vincentii]EEV19403.1 addiction module toxin, RelE/StbE family [Treponema vincentii ATCC 35580]EPF47480.1 RelE/StbE family addiction module toxin [Treponema vincentii F0403]